MRFYNIVFIEGVTRIGKSSQCTFLRKHLLENKIQSHIINIDYPHTPDELSKKIDLIRDKCLENPNDTIVVSGSIAFSIVHNDLLKQKYGSSYLDYEVPIKNFLKLNRELKIKNILIKSDGYDFLKNREKENQPLNLVEISMVYNGFIHFQTSQISDFKWDLLNIQSHDSILEINRRLVKLLE